MESGLNSIKKSTKNWCQHFNPVKRRLIRIGGEKKIKFQNYLFLTKEKPFHPILSIIPFSFESFIGFY